MHNIENILEALSFSREILYADYALYSNGKENLYLFSTDKGKLVANFENKTIQSAYELLIYYKLTNEKIKKSETNIITLQKTNIIDLFLKVHALKPLDGSLDKYINIDGRTCMLLFKDGIIKGYAIRYENQTHFITNDPFSCWSPEKNNIQPNQIFYITNSLQNIIPTENHILIQDKYLSIAHIIDKIGYANIRFGDIKCWFLGTVYYLNCNTPFYINIDSNNENLYSIETNQIDILEEYETFRHAHLRKYEIEPYSQLLKQIVDEISEKYNIPVELLNNSI